MDTTLAILSGRTEACIGQYMVIYLNQLIHSLLSIPRRVQNRMKELVDAHKASYTEEQMEIIGSIDLITFKIGDIMRAKCKATEH